jgi:flavin-dependent dehydrogenase
VAGKAAELGRGHRSFAQAHRVGARAAFGPLAHSVRSPIANGAVLIGDAAGFLNPFTGQGVFLALTSAENAARAILTSAANRSREASAFAGYAGDRTADLAARKRLSAAVGWLIDVPLLARRAAKSLARSPRLATTLVDALAGITAPESALTPAVLGKLVL